MSLNENRVARTSWILGLLVVLCLALVPTSLQATELGEQEVRTAVQTWVRYVTADAMPDAVIERMEPHQVEGVTVAYIAHLLGGGFCLCGADDLVLPVYLYSPQGTYDPNNSNYQYILWEIGARLKNLQQRLKQMDPKLLPYQEALSQREADWKDLIGGRIPARMRAQAEALGELGFVALDLISRWYQNDPLNTQCPALPPGGDDHCAVGCTATATAQVMYYWKWPLSGVGNASGQYLYHWTTDWIEEPLANDPGLDTFWWNNKLEWTAEDGGKLRMIGYWDMSIYDDAKEESDDPDYIAALNKLMSRLNLSGYNYSADFGATNYNWNIMPVYPVFPLDPEDEEVAKLCYHVGVAAGMDYGLYQSAASLWDVYDPEDRSALNALVDHFRYDEDAVYNQRNINTMIEEIQWFRPILFKGVDATGGGGHSWVVFGYNMGYDPPQFLMNMGQGHFPSWYTCDNVDYPDDQAHVTYIAPKNIVRFVGSDSPGDGSPDNPHENIEEALQMSPDGATLVFKAGSTNTFSVSPLVIDRPLTLKGYNVLIVGG